MDIDRDFSQYKNKAAVISDNNEMITYKQLHHYIEKSKVEFNKKELIFVLCDNCLECVVFYIVCLSTKMVPFLVDKSISDDRLNCLINAYQPKYCFVPKKRDFNKSYKQLRQLKNYILYCAINPADYKIYDELALVLPTSGTLGRAKAVRQSYKNITSNAKSIGKYLSITNNDRAIMSLPLSYTYGLSVLHSHLIAGATTLITKKNILDKGFWEFFRENRGTSLSGVPYTYELLRKINFKDMILPDLRYMTQAGGALGIEEWEYMQEYCAKTGVAFYVMYGQTEATARISYLPYQDLGKKKGSVGVAIPNGKIEIWDGEIVYKGENVCLGYSYNYSDLSRGDDWGGVLHTNDMGYLDKDGYLYLEGRKDRCVKILGKRINLDDLQKVISDQMRLEVYIIEKNGKLYIFSKSGDNRSMINFMRRELNIPGNFLNIKTVDDIPRKRTGKVDYEKLYQSL